MAPITREQALENALASSRMEGYEVTEQTPSGQKEQKKLLIRQLTWLEKIHPLKIF